MHSAAEVIMEIRLTQLQNMVFSREPGLGPAEGSAPSAGPWDTSLPLECLVWISGLNAVQATGENQAACHLPGASG